MRPHHAVAPAGTGADRRASWTLRRLTALPHTTPRKHSFPPVIDRNSRVLVLGTLPGEESLRRQQYYAHPRNLFWPILFGLFGQTPPPEYSAKLDFALRCGIGLWDVVAAGARVASADATIRSETPNAISALLIAHPTLRAIAFNGSTAQRLYARHFVREPGMTYLALPSTSPAHARLSLNEKLAQWQVLRSMTNTPD